MLDNYQDLIDELLGTPTALRSLLGSGRAPAEAVALVAALRDRDRAVLARLQTIHRQRDPVLKPLPDPPPGAPPGDPAEALAGFEAARGELVSLLMNLTLRDWERTAIDESAGELTLADEVERHVEFDEDHLARVRAAVGGG